MSAIDRLPVKRSLRGDPTAGPATLPLPWLVLGGLSLAALLPVRARLRASGDQ